MVYKIYFDESSKLDQPIGKYSYYGAIGMESLAATQLVNVVKRLNKQLNTESELHFVDYRNDSCFEKYLKVLSFALEQEMKINIIIVNKKDARKVAEQMSISLMELRELFYVKIPERLFYGLTRRLDVGKQVDIIIDENSEYDKIKLENKLKEQMNAHSAYRNLGYKVNRVEQACSEKSIPLQIVDILLGIVVFIVEKKYQERNNQKISISNLVKSDLIYRLLIENHNLDKFHKRILIYHWNNSNEIDKVNVSDYTGNFLLFKTQYDIKEMNRLNELMLKYPQNDTKFYREKMGYSTRQLRMIQGYINELLGKGRNSFYLKDYNHFR